MAAVLVLAVLVSLVVVPTGQATQPGVNGPLIADLAFFTDDCAGGEEDDVFAIDPAHARTLHRLAGTDAENPLVSPNGSAVAYSTPNGDFILRMRPGARAHRIKPPRGMTLGNLIAWSPNGKQFLAAMKRMHAPSGTPFSLGVIGMNGRIVRRILLPAGYTLDPAYGSWSSRGRLALALASPDTIDRLAIVTRDGRGPVIVRSYGVEDGVDWSPDGRTVAWSVGDRVFTAGKYGRAAARAVTDGRWPAWSPDGSALAVAAAASPGFGRDVIELIRVHGRDDILNPTWKGLGRAPDKISGLQWAPRAASARFAKTARTRC